MKTTINWLRKPLITACFAAAVGQSAAATLWVDDKSNNLFTVDTVTGITNRIGTMNVGATQVTDIAFDNSGTLWGITFDSLYRINTSNAGVERIGSLGGSSFTALVYGNGHLYAADQSPGNLYIIDSASGLNRTLGQDGQAGLAQSQNPTPTTVPNPACANLSKSSTCSPLAAPAFSSSGDLEFVGGALYLTTVNAQGPDTLVKLGYGPDATLGTVTQTIGSLGKEQVYGLATDGTTFFAAAGHSIYTVGADGLLGSAVAFDAKLDIANGATFYEGSVAGVPEPSTYALLLAGLGVMCMLTRRRLLGPAR